MSETILNNPRAERLKKYRQLLQSKQRKETGLILVEGISPVEQLIKHHKNCVKTLIIDQNLAKNDRCAQILADFSNYELAARDVVDAISENAKGILAIAENSIKVSENTGQNIVILNNLQDPGNAGTIIRAAAALNAQEVIFCGESVDFWSPKVIRASVGAVFQIPVHSMRTLSEAVQYAKKQGCHIIAADLYGTKDTPAKPLSSLAPTLSNTQRNAIVFGNEAHGLTKGELNLADACYFIPLQNGIESLNVAGAVHIFLWALAN